jgi:hypothetical protein
LRRDFIGERKPGDEEKIAPAVVGSKRFRSPVKQSQGQEGGLAPPESIL